MIGDNSNGSHWIIIIMKYIHKRIFSLDVRVCLCVCDGGDERTTEAVEQPRTEEGHTENRMELSKVYLSLFGRCVV